MGKVGKALFGDGGGGKSKSESGNYAWNPIKSAFTPALDYVTGGGNAMSALLGVGGDPAAQKTALENFSNSAGMQFLKEQGNDMVTSSQAAKGLLQSGDTLKELTKYGQGLGSTYLNSYMDKLLGLGNLGIGAGSVMANAGQWSKGESSQKGPKQGIAPTLMSAAAMIPGISDRRLKENIKLLGTMPDGLNVYSWTFKEGHGLPKGRHTGVMADEVKELRPHAYIENFHGKYAGVDYGVLNNVVS